MPRREHFKTHEEYLQWYRDYRKNNKEKIYKIQKKYRDKNNYWYDWKKRNKEKYRAHRAVYCAVKKGVLVRKPCEICSSTDVHAHHDDYSKVLEVRWLCRIHHKEFHKNNPS